MNFCWVTLPVKDFKRSLDFYHGVLGLPINSKHDGGGMQMVMLGEEDKPKIELIFFPDNESTDFASDITVGIAVESMNLAMELLKKNNIPITRGPIAPNPNIQFVYITDPNGYEVQLVEMKKWGLPLKV